MSRFTELIHPHETVREVVQRFPQTLPVFEQAGIRMCCFDCAIRTAAIRGGIDLSGLLTELDRAACGDAVGAA
jgi:hypothetical protein